MPLPVSFKTQNVKRASSAAACDSRSSYFIFQCAQSHMKRAGSKDEVTGQNGRKPVKLFTSMQPHFHFSAHRSPANQS